MAIFFIYIIFNKTLPCAISLIFYTFFYDFLLCLSKVCTSKASAEFNAPCKTVVRIKTNKKYIKV